MSQHDPIWDAYEDGRPRPRLVSAEVQPRPPLLLHAAKLPDPASIAPRQWLYATQLLRGFVTVLVAPGGTGKSSYAMAVALSLACGRPLLGDHVFERVNTSVFNLEDPMEELDRRTAALMIRHSIVRSEIAGRYFLDDGEGRGLVMAKVADDGFEIVHPDEDALIEQIRINNIGLTVCDPFAESHQLEENSNPQMVQAAKSWRRVARATNTAVLLVHHVRKGDATGIDAARGAKALTDSARVGLLLTPMSADDAKLFGVEESDRWGYVRLDDAKRNMAPAARARWLQLDQVALGNQTPEYPSGDHVAALVRWEPPKSSHDPVVLNRILDIIAAPPAGWLYSPTNRGNTARWAGRVLTAELGCTDAQAGAMLKVWLANGVLYVEQFRDESRKMRDGLRVNDAKRPSVNAGAFPNED